MKKMSEYIIFEDLGSHLSKLNIKFTNKKKAKSFIKHREPMCTGRLILIKAIYEEVK